MNEQELLEIEKRHKDIELPDSGFVSAEYRLPYPEETYGDWMLVCQDDWSGTQTIAQRVESEEIATFMAGAFQDIPALIAEVRRLTQELAEMTEDRDSENRWAKEYFDHWNESRDEVERLTAENARLRAQVETAKDIVQAGIQLMPIRKLAQWSGVRFFLEQDTDEYNGGNS